MQILQLSCGQNCSKQELWRSVLTTSHYVVKVCGPYVVTLPNWTSPFVVKNGRHQMYKMRILFHFLYRKQRKPKQYATFNFRSTNFEIF